MGRLMKAKKSKKAKYKFKDLGDDRPSTGEFWYDISAGGYLKAKDFSDDPTTIKAIEEAVKLLSACEEMCELN
jgi:hypothetical protein